MIALAAMLLSSVLQAAAPVVITLERTTCFGECPVYTVEIAADGSVRYDGSRFVRVSGPATGSIPPDALAALLAEAGRIGYMRLNGTYDRIVNPDGSHSMVTDLPTTITSVRIGSTVKRVVDYIGAPPALKDLERHIDEAAGTRRWISVTPDVVLDLQRGGWNAAGEDGAKWLRQAVSRADVDTVRALLDAGADPNGAAVPVLVAARDPAIIRTLVAAGADVNARTSWGEPVLMTALQLRRADTVAALVAAGADVNAANPQTGQTPLQLAIRLASTPGPPPFPGDPPAPHDEQQIVALLRAAGAK